MAGQGGVIGAILGWVGYQLGMRTDSASATGSLHAKVKDVKNVTSNIQDLVQDNLPTNCLKGSVTCSARENEDITTTLINLQNKKGKLYCLRITPGSSYDSSDETNVSISIALDGVSLIIFKDNVVRNSLYFLPLGGFYFNQSCEIEVTTREVAGYGYMNQAVFVDVLYSAS